MVKTIPRNPLRGRGNYNLAIVLLYFRGSVNVFSNYCFQIENKLFGVKKAYVLYENSNYAIY